MLAFRCVICSVVAWISTVPPGQARAMDARSADVCVYGATASGIAAAVAVARDDRSVILVEPSRWLGGMPGGGIGVLRDCLYANDVGGLALRWLEQERAAGCTYETHFNQAKLRAMWKDFVAAHGVEVVYEHRASRATTSGKRLAELVLDYAPPKPNGCPTARPAMRHALAITARVFIDASYEGDLMALAGVSYAVGRESRDAYGESLAGQCNVQTFDISAYVDPDDPSSGLLPLIDPEPYQEGAASRHTNAFNFRLLWREDGTPLPAPRQIDREKYALIARALSTGQAGLVAWPHENYERAAMISGGIPGRQADYAEADWPQRAAIWQEWIDHVQTMHALTHSRQGLLRGEYPDTNDFPHALYIRQGRRLIGEYVMTQHDLMLQTDVAHPVGLGYHPVDIYPTRLIATPDGKVANEGAVMILASPGPYQIPYQALIPQQDECTNLLVSVCMSASHVAMAANRIEVPYMIMGEAAGIAAVQAIATDENIQDIDMDRFRDTLLEAGAVLAWDGTSYGDAFVNDTSTYADRAHWWEHPADYRRRPYATLWKGERPRSRLTFPLRTDPWEPPSAR